MLEFYSVLSERIFSFWLRICQLLGLILVEFNKDTDKFQCWRFSSIYCATLGSFVTVLYLLTIIQFEQAMVSSFSAFSFTIFISICSELLFFVYMVLSYQQQYANRHKIRDTLNSFVFFYRTSKETYKELESEKIISSYQWKFFISVFIKFCLFIANYLQFYFLLDDEKFKLWFGFLAFPYIVASAICNQFFLGVLIMKYFLSTINRKLNAVITKIEYQDCSVKDTDLKRDLDKIFHVHTKLFEFHYDLARLFGFQMMLSVFNNFLNLAIISFQLISALLVAAMGFKVFLNFNNILITGVITMILTVTDILFHMEVCANCIEDVSWVCFCNLISIRFLLENLFSSRRK